MEDAEIERNVIFNSLAGLDPLHLNILFAALTFHDVYSDEEVRLRELMLDVMGELLRLTPKLYPPRKAEVHHRRRVPVPREEMTTDEQRVHEAWMEANPDVNTHIWAANHGVTDDQAQNVDFDEVCMWWSDLSLEGKRVALDNAGVEW